MADPSVRSLQPDGTLPSSAPGMRIQTKEVNPEVLLHLYTDIRMHHIMFIFPTVVPAAHAVDAGFVAMFGVR